MPYRNKLPLRFYSGTDVVLQARELLGKVLVTSFDGIYTSGIISETEAYNGIIDKASHAFGGRRTGRTEIMYSSGGVAYIYLCYGIHSLFNVVTGKKDDPHAVLIRGVIPCDGIPYMEQRRKKKASSKGFSSGPGSLSVALGIHYSDSGVSLQSDRIWIEDRKVQVGPGEIEITPRIGVDYAGKDAALPYRFVWHPGTIWDISPFQVK